MAYIHISYRPKKNEPVILYYKTSGMRVAAYQGSVSHNQLKGSQIFIKNRKN